MKAVPYSVGDAGRLAFIHNGEVGVRLTGKDVVLPSNDYVG